MAETNGDLHGAFQNNDIHSAWESVYRSDAQRTFNERLMARILPRLGLAPGSLVLDAGCGTGEHTLRLAKHGFKCVGVDVSHSVVAKAAQRAQASGLDERVTFVCEGLESLPFADAHFDAVHCRGVLMHIPRWQQAVAELCRVLRPGGKVLIMEGNHHAVEAYLVRAARLLRKSESTMVHTPGGIEFVVAQSGQAPLSRLFNVRFLISELRCHGVRVTSRIATEFWDLNRFPAGMARKAASFYNRLWLTLKLPAGLSGGNALIGDKLV